MTADRDTVFRFVREAVENAIATHDPKGELAPDARGRMIETVLANMFGEHLKQEEEGTMPLVLRAGDGWTYNITDSDIKWMIRAAAYEGGNPADTMWTWMQRFAGGNLGPEYGNFRARFSSLEKLVRAHSQPVNPIWLRTGSKCKVGGPYHGQDPCSEGRLVRREEAQSSDWESRSSYRYVNAESVRRAREAGELLRRAALPNPVPRSIDFAVPDLVASFLRRNPQAQLLVRDGNHFIMSSVSKTWPANYISLELGGMCDVILIGDSQGEGLRPRLETRLPSRRGRLVAEFTEVGWGTRKMLTDRGAQIRAAITAQGAKVALVTLGGNDTAGTPVETAYRELVALLKSAGIKRIVWIGPVHAIPADVTTRKRAVAALQKRVFSPLGVVWYDGLDMTRDLQHTPDGVHFVGSSLDRFADRLVDKVIPESSWLWSLTPFGSLFGSGIDGC